MQTIWANDGSGTYEASHAIVNNGGGGNTVTVTNPGDPTATKYDGGPGSATFLVGKQVRTVFSGTPQSRHDGLLRTARTPPPR
jgi:hypothetical protein